VEESKDLNIDHDEDFRMILEIDRARDSGDTVGGAFEVIARGVPVGLGSYVQWDRRLDGIEFIEYIQLVSSKVWNNLTPKEAQSEASDFFEYYDKELDNNGYLRIGESILLIERPSLESNRMYQFNKRKMESFLYVLLKKINS
jgi:hypothetical protein